VFGNNILYTIVQQVFENIVSYTSERMVFGKRTGNRIMEQLNLLKIKTLSLWHTHWFIGSRKLTNL